MVAFITSQDSSTVIFLRFGGTWKVTARSLSLSKAKFWKVFVTGMLSIKLTVERTTFTFLRRFKFAYRPLILRSPRMRIDVLVPTSVAPCGRKKVGSNS